MCNKNYATSTLSRSQKHIYTSIHPTENPVFLSLYFFLKKKRRKLTSTESTLSARWCGDVGVVVDLELANSPLEGTISKGNESFYQPTNHHLSVNICDSSWGITYTYHFSGDICESSWGITYTYHFSGNICEWELHIRKPKS